MVTVSVFLAVTLISPKETSSEPTHRIAVFTPITHAALQEIEQGFKDTLSKSSALSYEFTTFNANGNKTLQRAQAEEIIHGTFDLVFTIGSSCTQLIAEISRKKHSAMPQVFCSIEDPVGMGIVDSLSSSGNQITGVIEGAMQANDQVKILRALKPDAKRVLLVYDPAATFGMEKERAVLESLLEQANITLQSIEVSQANEISQKASALIANNDMVLVLKDNTVVSGIDSLITLCNRYGVALFVSDLNSGQKGAAIAYGIKEYDSGVGAALKAEQIFAGKKPADIPITPIDKLTLVINKNTMKQQNLLLDPELLQTIDQTGSLKELS